MKKLAMDEEQLSKMPMATQPEALKAQLLPYQLQVRGVSIPTLPCQHILRLLTI
jgi:hypothetical protein